MNVFSGNPTLKTPPIGIDGEMNFTCMSVATSILASSDSVDGQIVDDKLRAFAQAAIEEASNAIARRGKTGDHCFFCGTDTPLMVCGCEFSESFRCGGLGRYICTDCHRAHMKVAKHLKNMFAAPRSMRSNSRRRMLERELYGAACAVASPTGDADDYEPHDTSCLAFYIAQADSFDQEAQEFRHTILDAFRLSRFLDFKALAAALAREEDATLLRQIARAIRMNRPRGMSKADEQFYK
jgi:hypothetical protein